MGIVDQLASAPLERQRTRFQQIGMIAHVERGGGILLDHQNRRAGIANAGDDVERALDDVGREAERRLVEQDELRAATSARGRSQASAARRRTTCPPPAGGVRQAAETARKCAPCRLRSRGDRCADSSPSPDSPRTVMCGNTWRPSGQCAIPSDRIARAEAWVMSSPSKMMCPAPGATSPRSLSGSSSCRRRWRRSGRRAGLARRSARCP